ncbi:hypothetical protein [Hymenobacter psychrophilus]|uniref:Uncharacterized protein n=1 Tax=Hymenobacter psychrophilus TaxID=651662 RepID=A0A1H3BYN0_9BACT|nr:hypothetical protein [Hymenobacter psychrophilus]SDX46484.1 hypothetical protein SAMN04488069_101458 [Hymenobacter psychrophilus]
MLHYLRLRARLLGRQLGELGWWRLLVLGALLLLAVARALFTAATHPQLAWAVPLAVALFTRSLHRRRADLAFLHLAAPDFRGWLAVEYALGSLPVALALLGWGRVGPALLTVAGAAAVALVPAAAAPASRVRRPMWFRSVAFEWVSVGRWPALGLVWLALLAAAAATRANSTGPALAILVWLLLMLETYGPAEPWSWLLPALRTPGAWLRQRVGWALLYFGLTVAPLAAVLALGPAGAGGTALVLGWCTMVLTMVVLAKYAFYPHATLGRLTQAGAVVVGLSVLGSNPAYLALLLACFLGLLLKSRSRLEQYRRE